jgi:hypothetical protein
VWKEEKGRGGPSGRKAKWAGWLAGTKYEGFGLLNIPRLWKFVQGDLGGILIWGFFLNSSRLPQNFRKI